MSTNIQYENVSLTYEEKGRFTPAVENFNLEIRSGDFVGIIGESGCGKSTLLKLAAGLVKPSKGVVSVNGKQVRGIDKDTGYVFQGESLLPWLSVFDNVAIGFKIRGEAVSKKSVDDAIRLVGLNGFEAAKPKELSGGMAQRAAIARALVDEPDLLLLDEPFSALDAITRRELQNELLAIVKKRSITTVLVTHDFDEVLRMSNRIVLLSPRPGTIYKHYNNDRDDELGILQLRKTVTKDIYRARKQHLLSENKGKLET